MFFLAFFSGSLNLINLVHVFSILWLHEERKMEICVLFLSQIIIDSSESCMESESLLPVIVHRRALQLVLFGDPCQMQPAVTSATARSLGLAKSLLERYADKAVTLGDQYRMVSILHSIHVA
jgi:superfamily I DNA and/or RNA helicase